MTSTINTLRRSRWPWQNSIQSRLIIVVLLVVLIPLISIFTLSFLQTADTLQQSAAADVQSLGTTVTKNLDQYLNQRRGDIQVLSHAEILWGLDNTPDIKIAYLKSYQAAYNAYDSFYIADLSGHIVAATDSTTGYQSDKDWFKNALNAQDAVLSDVYYLDTAKANVLTISAPIINDAGETLGVVAGNINVQKLIDIVGSTKIGNSGEVVIVNQKGLIVVDPDPNALFKDVNHLKGVQAALRGETATITDVNDDGNPALVYYTPDTGLENWIAFVNVPLTEVNAPVQALALRAALLGLIAILIIAVAVLFVARRIVRPIQQLTGVAGRLSAGDFTTPIPVSGADEIGQLANTFRIMGRELQGLVDTLEERVQSRTRDLATTIEVGRLANSIYSQQELLPQLVEFIRSKFDLYYTQIYLLDEAGRFALLRAGTGEVGQKLLERHHKLDLEETSLVARAVKTREAVVVSDTENNPSHKPNMLLPATRSETAIPLQIGDVVLGVLDMQANRPNTFTQENASVFEALAGQIAAVLRGAQAFDQVQAATTRAEAINERLTNETWGGYLDTLANGQQVGYEYDLEMPRPLSDQLNTASSEQVAEPIVVRGAQIGSIIVKNDDARFPLQQDDEELIQDTARLVAQALDQFRAFDEVKRSEENARSVQSFLDSIIENIPNMVFVKDAKDLRFISLNKAGEDLLGISRTTMIGKNDYDFYPQEQADWFTSKDREVLANDEMVDIPEELIQAAGGLTRYLHTKKIPIRDAQGHAAFLLGISEDITERKQAQAALVESERRYRQIIEEATDVVYTIDPAGFFTYISPSAKRLTGFSPDD
nr:PAS domain S-box protein [Anaerolineae bacterium]